MKQDLSIFTAKHKKFFKKPRTMEDIRYLFGDVYEANSFQSIHLIARNIKMINVKEEQPGGGYTEKLHLVNYDYQPPVTVK